MNKKENIDLILILVYPIVATFISLLFKLNSFVGLIVYYVVPSVYLSIRKKEYIKKTLVFSLIIAVPLAIIIDYIGYVSKSWAIENSIFPFRYFEILTVEGLLWAILTVYFAILFYEYFIDKHVSKKLIGGRMKYLIVILIVMMGVFLTLFFLSPTVLKIPYFYLWIGIIMFFIPVVLELFGHPKLIGKFMKAGSYFFYFNFLYEIVGVKLDWWSFPGTEFIGWLTIAGVRFPFEELFFYIMLTALAILTYYEFYDDDQK